MQSDNKPIKPIVIVPDEMYKSLHTRFDLGAKTICLEEYGLDLKIYRDEDRIIRGLEYGTIVPMGC
mgnify:CR=1 FL=1